MDEPLDVPEFSMDTLLSQLIDRAQDVVAARSRLYKLIAANNTMVSNLDLNTVLQRIAESAADLVNAKYAAIGVIGPDGDLEHFTYTGMSEAEVQAIGHLPEGKGLLGALLKEAQPLRLADMSQDPRSVGFPANHPPMKSFLGVPIMMRGEVLGRLYLSDRIDGEEFTHDDEMFATSLAATAGIAISNARLLDNARYKERWSRALAESMRAILSEEDAMGTLIAAVRDIADADLVAIIMRRENDELTVEQAVGDGSEDVTSLSFSIAGSRTGDIINTGAPTILPDLDGEPLIEFGVFGSTIITPISSSEETRGLLAVARHKGKHQYTLSDVEMAASFADQAGIAIDRMKSLEDQRRMELLEDRNRIARDLHDHVIQRLFAAGLSLKAVATKLGDTPESQRVSEQITELDDTIGEIRHTIFALQRGTRGTDGVRSRIMEIIDRVGPSFVRPPRVQFTGPVDLLTDTALSDDIVAVVNEALTNVVRHANATTAHVVVAAIAGQLSVEIRDDGEGLGDGHGNGLANMRHRAEQRGGEFEVRPARPHGTNLTWTVPV